MASSYSTPAALKQSFDAKLKNTTKTASQQVGAWHLLTLDRFLCRLFLDPESPYMLKGGFGMLARQDRCALAASWCRVCCENTVSSSHGLARVTRTCT